MEGVDMEVEEVEEMVKGEEEVEVHLEEEEEEEAAIHLKDNLEGEVVELGEPVS